MSRYCMFHDNTTHAPVEQIPRLPSLADESRQMNIQGSCTSYIRSRQELRRICLGLSMACCHSALVPMACRLRASKIPVDSALALSLALWLCTCGGCAHRCDFDLYLSEKADKKSAFSTCRISCPGRQGDPARVDRYHQISPPLIPVLRALTLLPTLTAAQTAFILAEDEYTELSLQSENYGMQ